MKAYANDLIFHRHTFDTVHWKVRVFNGVDSP